MPTVNLFDNTFRHDVGSVAGKPPSELQYVRDQPTWDGVTLFVDGCAAPETVRGVKSTFKVGWLHEPYCLYPHIYSNVDWDGLDLVLTYHKPFLSHPKARLVPTGGVWIPRDKWGMRKKTKLISMLYGTKDATPGHRYRPEVAAAIRNSGKVDFYGAEGTPCGYGWQTKEQVLAPYAFSIIIENCHEPNYFDEMLCDCFAMGTVPILCGFPNYHEWFNPKGILPFEKLGSVQWLVNYVTMGLYEQMREAVQDNLERVSWFEITDDLVGDVLMCEGYL